jgi:acyl carrier protein
MPHSSRGFVVNRSAVVAFVASEITRLTGLLVPASEETDLDALALDSLQCIELTVAVEDEFRVHISCAERISLVTVGDFADLVARSAQPLLRAA